MPVGLTASLTRSIVDFQAGTIAQKLNVVMEDIDDLAFMLAGMLDADLVGLGYDDEEILALRTAVNEMEQLKKIYQGIEALPTAKDFRTFIRRIWGTGFAGS